MTKGGGKSFALRNILLILLSEHSNARGLLIRRTYDELVSNHIDAFFKENPALEKHFNRGDKVLQLPNGSTLRFRHLQHPSDVYNYQGQEFDYIGIDELTQHEKEIFTVLRSSNRTTNPDIQPRMLLTGNPGGIGHQWVKKLFIDQEYEKGEQSDNYFFVPAKVWDNKELVNNDPEYIERLKALPDWLERAYLEGDWDIFAGQYFTEWRRDKHVIEPFKIPPTWRRYRAIDFGRTAPYCCKWYAIDYDGNVYVYREYYQAGLDADQNIEEVKRLSKGERYQYTVGDASMWSKTGHGETLAQIHIRKGIFIIPSSKDRIAGWNIMHQYLRWNDETEPKIKYFSTCRDSIRTIPSLIHDELHPEDLDDTGEDHCLVGDTKVDTLFGKRKIKDLLRKEVYVNSMNGFVKCRSVRKIGKMKVYKLTLSNGKTIKATQDHKFLTISGWKELKDIDIRYDLLIQLDICIKLYLKLFRSLMASVITSVVSIFKDKARDYILQFGDTTMEKSQAGFISTIKTITEPIITYPILKKTQHINICPYMPLLQKQSKGQEKVLRSMLSQKQLNGTNQKRVGNGTVNMEKKLGKKEIGLRWFVVNARKNIRQHFLKGQNTAIKIVKLQPDGEEWVYDLTVPNYENFTISGGIVVHNCADTDRYFLQTLRERKTKEPLNLTQRRLEKYKQSLGETGGFNPQIYEDRPAW